MKRSLSIIFLAISFFILGLAVLFINFNNQLSYQLNQLISLNEALGIKKTVNFLMLELILLLGVLICFFLFCDYRKNKRFKKTYADMLVVAQNVPGAILVCEADLFYTVHYVNAEFEQITGYSKIDLKKKINNAYQKLINPDDFRKKVDSVLTQLEVNKIYEIEYRITNATNQIRWVHEKGQKMVDDNGKEVYVCVLQDITSLKDQQNQHYCSKEKIRIFYEQSQDILFELNVQNRTILFSHNFSQIFGFEPIHSNFPYDGLSKGIIHPEDGSVVYRMLDELEDGAITTEGEIRFRGVNQEYFWYNLLLTNLLDEQGNPILIMGRVKHEDLQKKEIHDLKVKNSMDSLTNVYNKVVLQDMITHYIENEGTQQKHAFIIIDINNFKAINDKMSYQVGDLVLQTISQSLKRIFRTSDIIGRVGGDEFVVFLKNTENEEIVSRKAKEMQIEFNALKIGNQNYPLSCSMGIAFYPLHGINFKELYKNADKALYTVKNHEQSNYEIYTGDE